MLLGKYEAEVCAHAFVAAHAAGGVAAGAVGDAAAATDCAVFAGGGAFGGGLRLAGVVGVPVLAPLRDVAAHVVDAEFVGLFLSHVFKHAEGVRVVVLAPVVPGNLIDAVAVFF